MNPSEATTPSGPHPRRAILPWLGSRTEAALFVVFASAAFATSAPIARAARPVHPLVLAFGRVALAAAILFAADPGGIIRSFRSLDSRRRLLIGCAGVLLAVHFALFLWGLHNTSLPAAVSLISLQPLSVVVCAWFIHGIRPTRLERAGVITATAGGAVVAHAAGMGEHRLAGDLMVIGAVGLYGVYLSFARLLRDALPARSYAALVYTAAALALGPAVALSPDARNSAWPMPAHGAIAIVALALVPTVLGHTAVQAAARTLSPSIVALVSPGETIGALAIGAVVLGAVPAPAELAGAAVIVCGSVIAILGSTPPTLHFRAPSVAQDSRAPCSLDDQDKL
jgi:drug/metabolite transporter (DMT)-like permease